LVAQLHKKTVENCLLLALHYNTKLHYNNFVMPKEKNSTSEWSSVPSHRHCIVCGKSVSVDKDICSDECNKTLDSRRKSQKRSTWIFMGVLGAMAVVWLVLLPMLQKPPAP